MMVKKAVKQILRCILAPVRWAYRSRNGVIAAEERHELPNDAFLSLVSEKIRQGYSAIIWVKGYSMRPFLEYGRDKVKLVPPVRLEVGDAVLAQVTPGHYVLHRIIEMQGEQIVLQGDGNVEGVERCRRSDVCGVVAAYIRPRRTILAGSPTLKRNVRIWRRLRPVRRFLLFLYKLYI